ncbi:aromatase/cyclase [Amycolatopsis samaneae]|uniref:Aromatase/cyclase n=1 Tax=Amycolatopsis samaneae TaxID=664691 RepID=A0ABW5GRK0_9PSEU
MTLIGRHRTQHTIDIDAAPEVVYRIIADAPAWPQHFAPTIHVEQSRLDRGTERLRIWAAANAEVKSWTSIRHLDPAARRIRFRQEVSSPPVAGMGGEWHVRERPGGTRLVLDHDFDAVGDDPAGVAWITEATDTNSRTELANIRALAENWDATGELVFAFDDAVLVRAPLEIVYDFLYAAAEWPERLPHVAGLDLTEDVENIQRMAMETRTRDGSTHTTESIRICFPGERIVYKQLVPPSLMTAHTGEWLFERTANGVLATSRHTVTLNEDAIERVLGAGATVASAREFVRRAAGGNSRDTLALAKEFAEASHV